MSNNLFPPYLNQGSQGAAVLVLQAWLIGVYGESGKTQMTSTLDEKTAADIKRLQTEFQIDVDGHFGPGTRATVLEAFGVDFDNIPNPEGLETRWYSPDGHQGLWPTEYTE